MDAHIQVKNLNVYYGKQQALKDINIEIPKKSDHRHHGTLRLRQDHPAQNLQPFP